MLDKYEEKLKNSITNYEIKTSADDILKLYSSIANKNKKHLSRKSKITLSSILGSLVLTGAVVAIVFTSLSDETSSNSTSNGIFDTPIEILNANESELLASEIASLMNNNENDSTYSLARLKKLNRNNISQNQFQNIVNGFDLAAPSIHSLFGEENIYDIKSYSGEFNIKGEIFDIRSEVTLNDQLLYSLYINEVFNELDDDEESWYYRGYIQDNNNYYQILLEKDIEQDEYEIESYIFYNEFVASVSKEIENDESQYQFSYFEYISNDNTRFDEDNPLYSFQYESENSSTFLNTNQISVEVETRNSEFEFFTKIINSNYYQILIDDDDYEGFKFDLNFIENSRIYSSQGLQDIIK